MVNDCTIIGECGGSSNNGCASIAGGGVMGEHKYNPTATAAKNGELPPKKKPMGTAESR